MNQTIIGIDTSNYRTSVAAVSLKGQILINERLLLPVTEGERGLRQREAVFSHLRQMEKIAELVRNEDKHYGIAAIAASVSPRDGDDSYMPVFQVGTSFGRAMAALLGVPFFATTHQRGHLAAAAAGTCLEGHSRMLALHLSGGTTDLLQINEGEIRRIGGSLDLHAGQLVDRTGVALGLSFPAGPELEELARNGKSRGLLGSSMSGKDLECHFSGAEAQVMRWIENGGMKTEDIAREVFDLLARTIARMTAAAVRMTGIRDVLITGGIASSKLFRQMLEERMTGSRTPAHIVFGSEELSGDNAVGVALIGVHQYLEQEAHVCQQ